MAIEPNIVPPATGYIDDLVETNPVGTTDLVKTLDDHIRGVKNVLLLSFPNVDGPVNPTPAEFNVLDNVTNGTPDANKAMVMGGSNTFDMEGNLFDNPLLNSYRQTIQTVSISTGTLTLDCDTANVFSVDTAGAAVTTLSITNAPANLYTVILFVLNTTAAIAEPTGAKWPANVQPPNSGNATGYDVYQFTTFNAGSNWFCWQIGYNMS
jgi:hypothetical protein